ncbi:MAG: transporter substrate-binding domain-containing protein [Desulfobacter sp.]|nr:transporter substrate-binding domain-containing protein [Desulfobacter sp.]WDP86114.1 MAG: transporter substrate-binding domain-containing protein [Desulfobacter sp.]
MKKCWINPLFCFNKGMNAFCISILIIFLSTNLWAEEIVVAIADWPPYEYFDDQGQANGVNVLTVKGSANLIGLKVKFKSYPWTRCLEYVKEGSVDSILSLYRTVDREKFLYFVSEYLGTDHNVLFTHHERAYAFNGDLKSLAGETIIVARNNFYGNDFENANFIKKYEANNTSQIIEMIVHGRHPLGISSRLPLIHVAKKMKLSEKIKILLPPVSSDPYIWVSQKPKVKSIKILQTKWPVL